MKQLYLLPLSLLLIFSACENADNGVPLDESALLALLDADEAAGMDGFDSGGDMDLDHDVGLEIGGVGRVLSDTLSFGEGYRIRYGRRLMDRDRTVEFDAGEDTAIGLVTHTIIGEFIAKAIDTSNHEQIDSLRFTKEFSSIFTRKVRFVKVDDSSNPDGYHWKIDALTPMIGGSGDKVFITNLSFHALTGDLEVGEQLYSFTADDLGDLFIDRESLPTFTAFSGVAAYADITNAGPEYTMESTGVGEWVFLNYGRNRFQRGRRHLHDTGMFFDETMNDNTHSGAMRTHGPGPEQVRGVFRTFTEAIDLATMFVSDGGYNTSVWSIPYRVERP